MKISNWGWAVRDIASYPEGVKDPNESVLANAVNAANYDLASRIEAGERVLEIGCGAASWLRDHLPFGTRWEGVDVYERDSRGRRCIATRMGSVHELPFPNGSFDWVLANQSIEHWYEYGVDAKVALSEIARVLRVKGQAHINFPLYLHGHQYFVRGDMPSILELVDKDIWGVEEVVAYADSEAPDYKGWRRCGYPDKYICRRGSVATSFVVSLVLEKISDHKDECPKDPEGRQVLIPRRISSFRMAMMHGLDVFIWKAMRKLLRGRTGS